MLLKALLLERPREESVFSAVLFLLPFLSRMLRIASAVLPIVAIGREERVNRMMFLAPRCVGPEILAKRSEPVQQDT
jgi:hypothetical protein